MKSKLPKRKPTRLKGYDYGAPGAYFVTICVKDRKELLSQIVGDGVHDVPKNVLTSYGKIAEKQINQMNEFYDYITVDKYIVMPNHIHLLISITERINPFPTMHYDIPNIIGKYKAAVTRRVGNAFMHSGKLWQTSFYDHIVRSDADYQQIWQYITGNPSKWLEDRFYCE